MSEFDLRHHPTRRVARLWAILTDLIDSLFLGENNTASSLISTSKEVLAQHTPTLN